VIPVVYPQNRKLEAGRQFLIEEFQRIRKELEKALETTITDEAIEESFALYEAYRKAMRTFVDVAGRYPGLIDATARHAIIKAACFMDKEEYTDKINALIEALEAVSAEEHGQKKIILTGLLAEPDEFLDLFGENGLVVVADDLAQESRQFRVEAAAEGDALTRMAGRIADQDGCSFLYDDEKSRGAMLIDLKNKYNADGIVYCQLKFCDPEEFDYPIVKREMEEVGIPLLYIEIEQQMDSVEQLRTRIQTFAEIL
jgi:benzoyl-CoA reductase/2-hydroxyglutaryl-CoA dehydratase subunit BcrC/BadD/HgdB